MSAAVSDRIGRLSNSDNFHSIAAFILSRDHRVEPNHRTERLSLCLQTKTSGPAIRSGLLGHSLTDTLRGFPFFFFFTSAPGKYLV